MIDRLEFNILGGNDGPVEDVESIGHEVVGCFSRRNCGVGRIGDSGSKTLYRCDIDMKSETWLVSPGHVWLTCSSNECSL